MKTTEELKPNYAPVYAAAAYPHLASVVHKHGYALAVHGSLARDFDVIAVPWQPDASDPSEVVASIESCTAFKRVAEPEMREHGRLVYTISIGFGECAVDLSFIPRAQAAVESATGVLKEQLRKAMEEVRSANRGSKLNAEANRLLTKDISELREQLRLLVKDVTETLLPGAVYGVHRKGKPDDVRVTGTIAEASLTLAEFNERDGDWVVSPHDPTARLLGRLQAITAPRT